MKFAIFVTDKEFKKNNGGDLFLKHIGCGLKELGHLVSFFNIAEELPDGLDYVFFAGYWYHSVANTVKKSGAKSICHLEHFNADREQHPWAIDIKDIQADYYITAFRGPCVDWAEQYIGKKIIYFPFAACSVCNKLGKKDDHFWHDAVYVGHRFPQKDFTWLEHAKVEIMNYDFDKISDLYINTKVVPYMGATFQRGFTSSLFLIPGHALVERIFQVPMCGGFTIGDDSEDIPEFFSKDEVPSCGTKDDYIKTIKHFIEFPEEREPYIKRARERILKEHLYTHRLINLLKVI